MTIKVRYSSIDGAGKSRTFKTLAGAQKFAQHWIGRFPSIGAGYAVSDDGVGKITCQGVTLGELFPAEVGNAHDIEDDTSWLDGKESHAT